MSGAFFNLIYNKEDYCHTMAMWTAQLASAQWLEGCLMRTSYLLPASTAARSKDRILFYAPRQSRQTLHPCGPGETLIQNGWMELIENIYSKVSAPPVVLTVEPGNYHLSSTVFPKCNWEMRNFKETLLRSYLLSSWTIQFRITYHPKDSVFCFKVVNAWSMNKWF